MDLTGVAALKIIQVGVICNITFYSDSGMLQLRMLIKVVVLQIYLKVDVFTKWGYKCSGKILSEITSPNSETALLTI